MSVDIPVFQSQTRTADANDIYSYGFALLPEIWMVR